MPGPMPLPALYQPAIAVPRMLPVLLLLAAMALLQHGGDRWWADHLYAWQGGQWRYRDAWWTSQLLHQGGKWLSVAAGLGVAGAALLACCRPGLAHWRRPLSASCCPPCWSAWPSRSALWTAPGTWRAMAASTPG